MAEKYYIVNPTSHTLQIYDIVRILPGTEEEPSVTECTVNSDLELESIQGVMSWGLQVISQTEYDNLMQEDEEDDEEELPPPPPEKVKVGNRKADTKAITLESKEEKINDDVLAT